MSGPFGLALCLLLAPAPAVSAAGDPDELPFSFRVDPFADDPDIGVAENLQIVSEDSVLPTSSTDDQQPVAAGEFAAPLYVPSAAYLPAPATAGNDDSRGLRVCDIFPLFSGDPSLDGVAPVSDAVHNSVLSLLVGYDAFRGVADGSWQNNGIHTGANFGTRLGAFSDATGIGLQVGGTVGVYDWGGTDYRMRNKDEAQTQGFITYGLFRRARKGSPWSAGVVQDWMLNSTWSVFGDNPTFSQLRAQVGYAISGSNEFGLWGACRLISDSGNQPVFGNVRWQPHDQLNLFWHHKWSRSGADTWISIGMPEHHRLGGKGSLGDYIANALAVCPLSSRVSVYSSVMYMHQSGPLGGDSSYDEAWNFTVGIALYPRANSRSTTVAGQRWAPLIPVANNGSLLTDASKTY
ncbi:MAG: DUF6666 family protein [Planctomycetaceae bacterium]